MKKFQGFLFLILKLFCKDIRLILNEKPVENVDNDRNCPTAAYDALEENGNNEADEIANDYVVPNYNKLV